MTKLEINDETALIKIFKTISWLDDKRWKIEDNYNFINFFQNNLTNCEKILTHWVCYIADRQMPFERVWDKGGLVFSELIYNYSRNKIKLPEEILANHYERFKGKFKGKLKDQYRFKSTQNKNLTFASRYVTDDHQNILQTLQVLNYQKYNRSIITYIVDIMQKFQYKDDLLKRVACGLHLLTYQLKKKKTNHEEIIEILGDDKKFESKFKEFERNSTKGKKRLWCCVRDYKKGLYHKIFTNALRDTSNSDAAGLINKWKNLPMDQIELPGDSWNNNPIFRTYLFEKVLDLESIPKKKEMPRIIRELYIQLNSKKEINDFYPEQFDITFDFVPRMCDKKLCNVCLFGKNGVESICIPTEDKYCPVALLSCGYIFKCKSDGCILKEGISRGICKGGLR